jgi:hypothetical protein
MSEGKNANFILEAAKYIIDQKKQERIKNPPLQNFTLFGADFEKTTKDKWVSKGDDAVFFSSPILQKLHQINQAIIQTKESLPPHGQKDRMSCMENLKTACIQMQIVSDEEVSLVNSSRELLLILQTLRKQTKEKLSWKEENKGPLNEPSQELFISNNPYTLSHLCIEFSCQPEKLNKEFIENKRDFCSTKLEYYLAQYQYINLLSKNLEDLGTPMDPDFEEKNRPFKETKIPFSFDQVSEMAEKAIDNAFSEPLHNQVILTTLCYFNQKLVHDIDRYCNKLDLANSYLLSLEKARDIGL